ncbi:hypothetical protein ACRDNQ_09390 [Palleronia sp. KMU-117]|uniref:hypothetical protein n=1 Tax=Palleronia sp. KMU-117 TaxID=3434108 RepID=UPI003D7563A3
MFEDARHNLFGTWGFWSVLVGGLAVMLVFLQIAGPSLEPQPSIGNQIGEIAGDIARSAWESFRGEYFPEPEPAAQSKWIAVGLLAPLMGVVAIVLSLISAVRRENWHYPFYGAGLGGAAIVFYFFWWVAALIAGAMMIVAIVENLGSIFDGGLFGG